ncbi:GcrA family cell cycle regulator [Microvirga calopogonii]|uniref:GcrA family cell cycle regulator n=1 Tax=Microvirga calopogonii TaxID=2078013 RepID=UPI002479C7F0|nr:GcrA family cell cycle regulator [Microvirga calopogonii]
MAHEPDARAMPEISEPSHRTRTTLFKLRARQCRFIVSDERSEAIFCGGETHHGSSWCPWPRRLVYTKPMGMGSGGGKRSA